MTFSPEIKHFIKNTLIFTFIFSVIIHFSWDILANFFGFSAQAQNNKNFGVQSIQYAGNVATAISTKLGQKDPHGKMPYLLTTPIVPIMDLMHHPAENHEYVIGANMTLIRQYMEILQISITDLLSSGFDRGKILDEHIALLKSYFGKAETQLHILQEQKTELQNLIAASTQEQELARDILQKSFTNIEYEGVDGAITQFLQEKNTLTRANIYLIYIQRFLSLYQVLQQKNVQLITVLQNNRDPLSKGTIVTIPSTGSDLIKELGLIQSETEKMQKEGLME